MNVSIQTEQPAAGPWRQVVRRTFASFSNHNYRLFWSGQLVSQTGTWMQRIGQTWLVLEVSHSPEALGIVTALQFLPMLLFSAFAGVIVDRLPKYRMLIVTQSLFSIQSIVMAALTVSGHIQLWEIYVLATILGAITAYDNPNRQAFLMEMVGREHLANAVGLNSTTFNSARLIGPALGGLVIAAWGVGFCFWLDAASYVAVLVALLMMHTNEFYGQVQRNRARPRMLGEFAEGIRFVFRTPAAVVILITLGAIGCFGFNFTILMPLFATDVFHIGAQGFGLLMSAVGLGSLVAAFTFASRARSSRRNVLVTAGAFSAFMLVVALAPVVAVALGALVLVGFMSQYFGSSSNTLMQFLAPDALRGRVMGVYMLLFAGTKPIGGLITGYLAGALGARTTMGIEAGICALAAVCALVYARATRISATPALRVERTERRLAPQPVDVPSGTGRP